MTVQKVETSICTISRNKSGDVSVQMYTYKYSSKSGWCQKLRYLLATLLLGVLITLAGAEIVSVIPVALNDIQRAKEHGGGTVMSANYSNRLVARSQWSYYPDVEIDDLPNTPASYVVVCHSVSRFCRSTASCPDTVRGIESWGVKIGFTAVAYNFLIGGDGFIYEGRGWDKQGAFSIPMNCKGIGVGFVGNFEEDRLLPSMVEAYNILVEEGVRRGALDKDYKVVAANQVQNTASPGINIIKEIKNWPHWAPLVNNDDLCTNNISSNAIQ